MTTKLTDKNISNVSNLGLQWQSVITADGSTTTTAVAGQGYFIDTTSAAHTINLPASATAGDTIAIKDYAGTFATNNLTIGRNGHNIQGVANNSLISTNRANLELVYIDATKGWLYTNESNVGDLSDIKYVTATGGTVTTSGDYKIHTFTGDGCFVVSCGGNPFGSSQVSYLVVAGGGGGGHWASGGGGAGGYREGKVACQSPWTTSPLAATSGLSVPAATYPITVGGGGSQGTGPGIGNGTNGSNSVFSTITSTGGGRGTGLSCGAGGNGGSGGGGAHPYASGGTGNTPPVSPPQGNNGGAANGSGFPGAGAGGGGASEVGQNGTNIPAAAGRGGAGTSTTISGTSTSYAGGGGGGADGCGVAAGSPCGTGGQGGSSSDSPRAASNGTANRGGGGGGVGGPASSTAGAGGKGIVIIRYKYQ